MFDAHPNMSAMANKANKLWYVAEIDLIIRHLKKEHGLLSRFVKIDHLLAT